MEAKGRKRETEPQHISRILLVVVKLRRMKTRFNKEGHIFLVKTNA
jgi:hypothetical protein